MVKPARASALAALFLFPACLPATASTPTDTPQTLLAAIKKVGREGSGNPEAAGAWKSLVQLGPSALLPTLEALDGADPTASNWLRAAADAIAEKAHTDGKLVAKNLEKFVLNRQRSGAGRRIAYEWLCRVDPTAPGRLLPAMLDDPGQELRRDAVAVVLKNAEQLRSDGKKSESTAAFQKALTAARDSDQVDAITKALEQLGVPVDLAAHYGFVRQWKLIAPFDNSKQAGFDAVYPPEKKLDLSRTYPGKGGEEAKWVDHTTSDARGLVDLNKALEKHKGAVAYAWTVVESPKEQQVEIRAGCITAIKIFLNGKLVFGRDEYHHGMAMDQHIGRGLLKSGRNEILVKVCQNEQTEMWAQDWRFQLRLCDALGGAVPFKVILEKAK